MNGYDLSRQWFSFAFENPDKVTGNHTALYWWSIELNNRLGWVSKFGMPTETAMMACGIRSYKTFSKIFDDLVSWGFFELHQKSKNQYTSNIIALVFFTEATPKHSRSIDQSITIAGEQHSSGTVDIIKPVNKETNKQINISFDDFWNAYGKKEGAKKCRAKWESLTDAQRNKAMEDIPKYRASLDNPKYHKMPLTYLNGEHWNDERTPAQPKDNGGRPQYDPTQHPNSPHNARAKRVFL